MAETDADVLKLLDQIGFTPDDVVHASAKTPKLFVEAIKYRRKCLFRRANTKLKTEAIKAEVELAIRKKYREAGEKITEGNIDALLLLDKKAAPAIREFSDADAFDKWSDIVLEAFRMQRDCLRIVGGMTKDEYYLGEAAQQHAAKLEEIRRQAKERFPGDR